MSRFKTDYKDEIPKDGVALYNLVNSKETVIEKEVKIVRANTNEQEGDPFGAYQLNEIGKALNVALFLISESEDYIELGNYEEYLESIKEE